MMEDSLGPDGLVCPRCGAEFADEFMYRDHVSSHVTGDPNAEFICTLCGDSFQSQAELDSHAGAHMTESAAA